MSKKQVEYACEMLLNNFSDGEVLAWKISEAAESDPFPGREMLEDISGEYGVSLDLLVILAGMAYDG